MTKREGGRERYREINKSEATQEESWPRRASERQRRENGLGGWVIKTAQSLKEPRKVRPFKSGSLKLYLGIPVPSARSYILVTPKYFPSLPLFTRKQVHLSLFDSNNNNNTCSTVIMKRTSAFLCLFCFCFSSLWVGRMRVRFARLSLREKAYHHALTIQPQ